MDYQILCVSHIQYPNYIHPHLVAQSATTLASTRATLPSVTARSHSITNPPLHPRASCLYITRKTTAPFFFRLHPLSDSRRDRSPKLRAAVPEVGSASLAAPPLFSPGSRKPAGLAATPAENEDIWGPWRDHRLVEATAGSLIDALGPTRPGSSVPTLIFDRA